MLQAHFPPYIPWTAKNATINLATKPTRKLPTETRSACVCKIVKTRDEIQPKTDLRKKRVTYMEKRRADVIGARCSQPNIYWWGAVNETTRGLKKRVKHRFFEESRRDKLWAQFWGGIMRGGMNLEKRNNEQ